MLLKFAKNGILNNTMRDLFPLNNKKHKMETRTNEKFKVNHANTERLKHGSIITMQKLLNQDIINSQENHFNCLSWRIMTINLKQII